MLGLRDWSRLGGSYGNNTRVICYPAPGRPVINPDYNVTKQRYITRIYDKISSKSPPNRATSPTCLHCDVTHLSFTTGVVALHIPSRRVRVREEYRQARKTVWPVNAGRVICRYQNNLCGIINHHKHIWECFCDVQVAGLSIITMNHIDTGIKTAAGTHSPRWRTRLLVVALHIPPSGTTTTITRQKSTQSCYN